MSDLRQHEQQLAPFYLTFFKFYFTLVKYVNTTRIAHNKVSAGEFASCILYKQLYAFDNL